MAKLPPITEAEFEIMKVIWKLAPISTNEITERVMKMTDWGPKTVQTLIKRLVNKGALSYEKEGRQFVYTPLVEEKEYLGHQSSSFLDRYFNGNLSAMVLSYLENENPSRETLDSLRALLNEKSEEAEHD